MSDSLPRSTYAHAMDPVMHLVLPLLLLLALRIDTRKVLLLSPLAILPDFDAAFGLHRAAFHNIFFVVVLPLALYAFARLKRHEWQMSSLLVLFLLASHVLLDLGGVALFWPLYAKMLYLDPEITFNLQGGVNFGFELDYGWKEYERMGTTSFLSDYGFAVLFLGILVLLVFRKEAVSTLRYGFGIVKEALLKLLK